MVLGVVSSHVVGWYLETNNVLIRHEHNSQSKNINIFLWELYQLHLLPVATNYHYQGPTMWFIKPLGNVTVLLWWYEGCDQTTAWQTPSESRLGIKRTQNGCIIWIKHKSKDRNTNMYMISYWHIEACINHSATTADPRLISGGNLLHLTKTKLVFYRSITSLMMVIPGGQFLI